MAANAVPDASPIARIHEALTIVHSPYSTNDSRKEASAYLETLKSDIQAPYHGFTLASDKTQEPVVRHYALSLLENAIRHKWFEYEEPEANMMRGWVLQLSEGVVETDPIFLRNKTAQLWVEVAKRSWANQWVDMDQLLVQLWSTGAIVHKEFVLFVLENLSEEVFAKEDGSAAMREQVLKKACVEIFTPADVLQKEFPNRAPHPKVRYGDESWLVRLCQFLQECVQNGGEESRSCAVKILAVFRSVMPWVVPKAISAAHCVDHICQGLAVPDVKVQMAAIDALHSLYSRPYFSTEEYAELICPIFTTERVDLLRKIYEWSIIDHEDIDEEKYLLSKKLSEMMSKLGNFIEVYEKDMPPNIDLPNLLNLLFSIVQNKSFVVAIPVLVTWTHLLRSEKITTQANQLIAPLLQLCSSRLVRYEQLPEDSENPSLVLLLDDIDTIPERHAFLGNFRRYNVAVIEQIVRRRTTDAVYHILGQVWQTLEHLYDNAPHFNIQNYSKSSPAILQVDGQFTVVEAALKGFLRGRDSAANKEVEMEGQKKMEDEFQGWCERLMTLNFDDPLIKRRVIQLVVEFATSALKKRPQFVFTVLEHILMTRPVGAPEGAETRAYADAVKELKADAMYELSRLAQHMPERLLEIYDELEGKIKSIIAQGGIDERQQLSYQTFLFEIIIRAKPIDKDVRIARLKAFVDPVTQLWQNPALSSALQSFSGFMEILGMGKVNDYLVSRQVHNIADWATFQLDAEGVAIQTELTERVKALPLRPTKAFLTASTAKLEKVSKDGSYYQAATAIWADSIPIILPDLLKYLEHSHAFNNPSNWTGLPQEMQGIVPRILTDRFWQAGISGGSKDDFFARVSGTKTTMEGLASSIRGTVRAVREAAYSVLFGLSRFETLYAVPGLPVPLSQALFQDAPYLSSNQLITLLGLAKCMVDECPPELRAHFIPPVLGSCFRQIDGKITGAWEALGQRQMVGSGEEELGTEMREESLLRQVTNTAVMIVASLFDPQRMNGMLKKHLKSLVYLKFEEDKRRKDEVVDGGVNEVVVPEVTPGSTAASHPGLALSPMFSDTGYSRSGHSTANPAVSSWLHQQALTFPDAHPLDPSSALNPTKYPTIRRFCLSHASILEPLIVFSCHAIRMRDTRSCGVILRVFRSLVPEFANPRDPDNATNASIREYISEEVLKAAISSLHEPYYVDSQKDLAQLIAAILVNYVPLTPTPRNVLLSLPGMREAAVDQSLDFVTRMGIQPRQQRAIVLDLLRDLKGQSIQEQGRIQAPQQIVRKERSKMQEEFMMTEEQRQQADQEKRAREKTPEMEGMGNMFNQ